MADRADIHATIETVEVPANPIVALLRSRKFLLALFALIQALVMHYLDLPDEIWQSIVALVGVLIASIAYEDGQAKSAPVTVNAGNVEELKTPTPPMGVMDTDKGNL